MAGGMHVIGSHYENTWPNRAESTPTGGTLPFLYESEIRRVFSVLKQLIAEPSSQAPGLIRITYFPRPTV